LVISEQITTLNESFCMLLLVEDEKILNHWNLIRTFSLVFSHLYDSTLFCRLAMTTKILRWKTAWTGHEKCAFHHDLELDHRPSTREDLISDMANSYRMLLSSLGENPNRQVGKARVLCMMIMFVSEGPVNKKDFHKLTKILFVKIP
jgi:hypothetical protein